MKPLIIYPLRDGHSDNIDGLVSAWLLTRYLRDQRKDIALEDIEIKFYDSSRVNLKAIENDSWFDSGIHDVYVVDCVLSEEDYQKWKRQNKLIYLFCSEQNLELRSQIPQIKNFLVSNLIAQNLSLAAAISEKIFTKESPINIVHALNKYHIQDEDPKWEDIYYGVKAHFSQLQTFQDLRAKMACFWLDLIREKNLVELTDLLQHMGSAFKSYSCSIKQNQPTKPS